MSALKWILLGALFVLYLLFGGAIFMAIEQKREMQQNADFALLRKDVREILLKLDLEFYQNGTPAAVIESILAAKEAVINRVSESCGGHHLLDDNDADDTLRWTFYNSVFFAFTAVTTIGYGNLSPTTYWSRVFTIIYALFGIPINGILISGLSNYFSRKLVIAHKRSKTEDGRNRNGTKIAFVFDVIFYLIPGLLVFIVVPAGFFVIIENWSFLDAIYFSFVTLTTIGFGDYVAGMGDGHSVWLWLYKIIIIVWIIFGLGYFVMILSFITKGLTHKKVRIVINKKLNQVKSRKQKLVKDIDYMRRVVNELYLMKVKPIYNDEVENCSEILHDPYCVGERSISSPNIHSRSSHSHRSLDLPSRTRKFGISHHEFDNMVEFRRRRSETDLDRIDREKTFEEAVKQAVLPNELLATVVNAIQDNVNQLINDAEEEDTEYQSTSNDNNSSDEVIEILPPWELGMLDESDEEILIDKDDNSENGDHLVQVVIHPSGTTPTSKTSTNILHTPQLIHKKVSDIIRKISTGTKESSNENPSRKISHHDSDRMRKISNHSDTEVKKISYNPSAGSTKDEQFKPLKNISDLVFRKISKESDHTINSPKIPKGGHTPPSRKISKQEMVHSKSSDPSPKLLRTSSERNLRRISREQRRVWDLDNNMRQHHRRGHSPESGTGVSHYFSNKIVPEDFTASTQKRSFESAPASESNSRKISRENQFDVTNALRGNNYGGGVDHSALTDLLRALDSVHDRLKRTESNELLHKIPSTNSNLCPTNTTTTTTSTTAVPSGTSITNMGVDGGGRSSPSIHSKCSTTNSTSANKNEAQVRLQRRRKLGVFNPEFSFVNTAFEKDDCDNNNLTQDNNNDNDNANNDNNKDEP